MIIDDHRETHGGGIISRDWSIDDHNSAHDRGGRERWMLDSGRLMLDGCRRFGIRFGFRASIKKRETSKDATSAKFRADKNTNKLTFTNPD
jgi:hypothetical protein